MATGGSKWKKPDTDGSPDKSEQILSKALNVYGKCNKRCTANIPQQKSLQIWTNTEFRLNIKMNQSTL